MIIFSDNELELAMVTYNRPNYVKAWLNYCYDEILKRNITLSIYDSSTNDETMNYVCGTFGSKIKYFKVNSNVSVGYKPMYPILRSTHKYLWVLGDSRYHDFEELDKKIFLSIKKGIDYILISAGYNNEFNAHIFCDKTEFINRCFISSTCIGLSIFKTDVFKCIKSTPNLLQQLDLKYKDNYGFAWMGYFYECFADIKYKAIYHVIKAKDVIKSEKKQFWVSRFYECWVENLCNIVDNIPNCYESKYGIPRMVWKDMRLDSINYCCKARMYNGLNPKVLKKYIKSKLLFRVTDRILRVSFFSYCPRVIAIIIYKFVGLIRHILNS